LEVLLALSVTDFTTAIASFTSPTGPLRSETDTSKAANIGAEEITFHSSGV
jgi:hypothetical protein